jgi:UDP-3-O-[3-hydroxymyristoyl] glucosamine N-acyltransferase
VIGRRSHRGPGFGYLRRPRGHRFRTSPRHRNESRSPNTIDRSLSDGDRRGKLDNLVHVAHNVQLGQRCLAMAGVGIARTRIGDDVILAGHVGVTDHLVIGDGVRLAAKSAVFGNVPARATFSGHPARPHLQYLRAQAALYRLAPIITDLERLVHQSNRDG